jgi:hypothetical protein
MKSDNVCVSEKIAALSDEQVDVLMDIICAGEEFALLRETLRLYAEEVLVSETVH